MNESPTNTSAALVTREQLIAEARTWRGTRFHHQARQKGVGVDCIGLIVAPARALGIPCTDEIAYSRQPNREYTLERIRESFVEIDREKMLPGDVWWFWFGTADQPDHFGYKTDIGILHAYDDVLHEDGGRRPRMGKAVETHLPTSWFKRIDSAWRFKYFAEAGL